MEDKDMPKVVGADALRSKWSGFIACDNKPLSLLRVKNFYAMRDAEKAHEEAESWRGFVANALEYILAHATVEELGELLTKANYLDGKGFMLHSKRIGMTHAEGQALFTKLNLERRNGK